jgi:hypothetical protein
MSAEKIQALLQEPVTGKMGVTVGKAGQQGAAIAVDTRGIRMLLEQCFVARRNDSATF